MTGKTVAIVGPSSCVVGSGFGKAIESHDLVARINHQWPIKKELENDLGSRMDLLFHCCNGDFPIRRMFVAGFESVQHICFENNTDAEELRRHCQSMKIPTENLSWRYRALTAELGTPPNTGLVAICHLLDLPIVRLGLFGITFFKESYYHGYLGDGAKDPSWQNTAEQPERIWQHDLKKQFTFFTTLANLDPRIQIDSRSMNVMQIGPRA